MAGFIYLVKKKDLFMIGRTNDIEKEMKRIRPDELITTSLQDYPEAFEARLLRRYRDTRLPDSGYFQFTEKQLIDCKNQFGIMSKVPKTLGEDFYIALTACILIAAISGILFIRLRISFLLSTSVLLLLSSIPMWLLFILGNFGGYFSNDIRLFSACFNRLRALLVATFLSLIAYFILSKLFLNYL